MQQSINSTDRVYSCVIREHGRIEEKYFILYTKKGKLYKILFMQSDLKLIVTLTYEGEILMFRFLLTS